MAQQFADRCLPNWQTVAPEKILISINNIILY
jgi:hypothetical protein